MPAPIKLASALLAVWLFLLALAGVSPVLHSWLHVDASCASGCGSHGDEAPIEAEGHYCAVIALQATLDTVATIDLPARAAFLQLNFEVLVQKVSEHESLLPFQARAPPLKS